MDSAAGALAEMDRAVPDVLLCDISMPHEDGYRSSVACARDTTTAGGGIPAAAVTAYARPEDVRHALAEGFDLHFAKPLEPQDLVAAVVRLAHKPRSGTATALEGRNSPT